MKDKSNIRRNSRIIPTKDKNDHPVFYGQVYDYNIETSEECSVKITSFNKSKAIVESETKSLLKLFTNHTEERNCFCLNCRGNLYNKGFYIKH
jgi:hypothetical protein